ncbi:MAG: hypothetical protein ACREWE_13570, partial [Gammaproteobacteria bacterium]
TRSSTPIKSASARWRSVGSLYSNIMVSLRLVPPRSRPRCLSLVDPLDAQHLLDLMLDGEPVLEVQTDDPARYPAGVCVCAPSPRRGSADDVLLEAQEIGARQSLHVVQDR